MYKIDILCLQSIVQVDKGLSRDCLNVKMTFLEH